jgi:hypothetical protein
MQYGFCYLVVAVWLAAYWSIVWFMSSLLPRTGRGLASHSIASHELAIGHGAAMSSLLPRTGHGLASHLAKAKPAVAGAPAVQAAGGGGAAGGRWVLSWAWVRV